MAAYWIAHVTVTDPERYAAYMALARPVFEAHGARFLARGGESVTPEGEVFDRHVVIAFESLAAAKVCYESPGYVAARAAREGAARVQVVIVEGA